MTTWSGIRGWFGTTSIGLVGAATILYSAPLLAGVWLANPSPPRIAPPEPPAPRARFVPLVVELEPEEPEPPAPEVVVVAAAEPTAAAVEPPVDATSPPPPDAAGGTRRPRAVRPKPGVARAAATTHKPRKNRACDTPNPQVRVRDDGVVEIDRALVDQYTENLEAFMKLGYSKPYDEEGVKGWYVSGFGCTSPVYKAGFRRADVLLTVNGKPTRSWVGVFLLYQKLKNRNEFEIALLRKGAPMTIRFEIVEPPTG